MLALHDTTHSPAGLWQFDETLNDTSGFNRHFSLAAGNLRYTEIYPGVRGLNIATANRFTFSTTGTALQHTGDITILLLWILYATADGILVTYDGGSEVQANNGLYELQLNNSEILWNQENGAGVNSAFSNARLPPLGELCHFASRRRSNVFQAFINGSPFGAASSALTTPDGGTTSFLRLGRAVEGPPACAIASLKICLSALTDAEIKEEYEKTLGGVHGTRTLRDVIVDGVAARTGYLAQYPFPIIEDACEEQHADIDRTLVVFK